jgi:hypothetical protein
MLACLDSTAMTKHLFLCLLCLLTVSTAAGATGCGFALTEQGMVLYVGANANAKACLAGPEFRRAFAAGINAGLAEEERPNQSRRRSIDDRPSNSARLWALEERNFQATQPSGRYYGQR